MQAVPQRSNISYSVYVQKVRRKKINLFFRMIALLFVRFYDGLASFDERLESGKAGKLEIFSIMGAGVVLYFALSRFGVLS